MHAGGPLIQAEKYVALPTNGTSGAVREWYYIILQYLLAYYGWHVMLAVSSIGRMVYVYVHGCLYENEHRCDMQRERTKARVERDMIDMRAVCSIILA